ncbi:MAG: hypothetical protein ACYCYR_09090 [Desulfobulbaceae bacterium]|jgi:hypothetical protein
MPKRTNQFQRLATLLHEQLDKNWTVTESEMLINNLTGEEREVDIVCRNKLGAHEIILSIECTASKRPAGSPWVECMAGKHEHLPTDKLILWSESGFSKFAQESAEKQGIETVAQDEEITEEWAKLAKIFKQGTIKLVTPVISHFFDYENSEGKKCRIEGEANYAMRHKNTGIVVTVNDVKEFFLTNNNQFRTAILDHATEDNEDFWAHFIPGPEWEVQKEDGAWVLPFRIGFGIKANTIQADVTSKSAKYEDSIYTYISGESKKGSIELFFKEVKPKADEDRESGQEGE